MSADGEAEPKSSPRFARLPRLTTWSQGARLTIWFLVGAGATTLFIAFFGILGPAWRLGVPLVGLPTLVFGGAFLARRPARSLRVRNEGGWIRVEGFPPFRAEVGEVQLESGWTTSETPEERITITHSSGPAFGTTSDPLVARAFAEGLCKVGRFPMRWTHPGGHEEYRRADALDLPYAERLRDEPPPEADPPSRERVEVLLRPDESIELGCRPVWPWTGVALAGLFAVGLLSFAFRNGLDWLAGESAGSDLVGYGAILAVTMLGAGILDRLRRLRVVVSRRGVEGVCEVLGWRWRTWSLPAGELESVYADEKAKTLVFMSDRKIGRLYLNDAADLEGCLAIVTRSLLGQRQPRDLFENRFGLRAVASRVQRR